MQRRRSHTVSILLGTSAKTALPGDPFRLGSIRLSRVLWLSWRSQRESGGRPFFNQCEFFLSTLFTLRKSVL